VPLHALQYLPEININATHKILTSWQLHTSSEIRTSPNWNTFCITPTKLQCKINCKISIIDKPIEILSIISEMCISSQSLAVLLTNKSRVAFHKVL